MDKYIIIIIIIQHQTPTKILELFSYLQRSHGPATSQGAAQRAAQVPALSTLKLAELQASQKMGRKPRGKNMKNHHISLNNIANSLMNHHATIMQPPISLLIFFCPVQRLLGRWLTLDASCEPGSAEPETAMGPQHIPNEFIHITSYITI